MSSISDLAVVDPSRQVLIKNICNIFEDPSNKYKIFGLLTDLIKQYEKDIQPLFKLSNDTPSKSKSKSKDTTKKLSAVDFASDMINRDYEDFYEDFMNTELSLSVSDLKTLSKDLSATVKKEWDKLDDDFITTLAESENNKQFISSILKVFKNKLQLKTIISRLIIYIKYDFNKFEDEYRESVANYNSSSKSKSKSGGTGGSKKSENTKHKVYPEDEKFNRGQKIMQKLSKLLKESEIHIDVSELFKLINSFEGANILMKLNNIHKSFSDDQKKELNKFFSKYPELDVAGYDNYDDAKNGDYENIKTFFVENQEEVYEFLLHIITLVSKPIEEKEADKDKETEKEVSSDEEKKPKSKTKETTKKTTK